MTCPNCKELRAALKKEKERMVYTEYTTRTGATESEVYTLDEAADSICEWRFKAEKAELENERLREALRRQGECGAVSRDSLHCELRHGHQPNTHQTTRGCVIVWPDHERDEAKSAAREESIRIALEASRPGGGRSGDSCASAAPERRQSPSASGPAATNTEKKR